MVLCRHCRIAVSRYFSDWELVVDIRSATFLAQSLKKSAASTFFNTATSVMISQTIQIKLRNRPGAAGIAMARITSCQKSPDFTVRSANTKEAIPPHKPAVADQLHVHAVLWLSISVFLSVHSKMSVAKKVIIAPTRANRATAGRDVVKQSAMVIYRVNANDAYRAAMALSIAS